MASNQLAVPAQRINEAVDRLAASKVLSSTEQLALQLEANYPRLSELTAKDLHNKLVDALSEIKLISGAVLYADGTPDQAAQFQVIKRFIVRTPRYLILTMQEITQAFYMNSAGTFGEPFRHYNRELNAEFIGDVLNAYLRWKDRFLSQKLGAITREMALLNGPAQAPPVITDDTWREEVLRDLAMVRSGNASLIFNTNAKYKYLRRLGYIRMTGRKMWWSWYLAAMEERRWHAYRMPTETVGQKADKGQLIAVLNALLDCGEIPREDHPGNVRHMRRYVYLQYLESFVACGITDHFNQVAPWQQ